MKTHFRAINRNPGFPRPQFRIACGCCAHWTENTTSDASKVDCKSCLAYIAKDQAKQKSRVSDLMQKAQLINTGNSAILPTGEIVAKGTPGAMNYQKTP